MSKLLEWYNYLKNEAPAGHLLMAALNNRAMTYQVLEPLKEMTGQGNFSINAARAEVRIFGRLAYLLIGDDEWQKAKMRGIILAGAYVHNGQLFRKSFVDMLRVRCSIKGAKLFF